MEYYVREKKVRAFILKKLFEEDKPKDEVIKQLDKEPEIENEKVKETLKKLGSYQYDP